MGSGVMEVVVGVDGSADSFTAAEWAAARAADTTARALRLVHVAAPRVGVSPWGGDGAGRMLDGLGTALAARYPGLRWSGKTLSGDPGSALATAGDGAGLLVVGARGGGGFPGLLLGSTALASVTHAACPVALVPTGRPERDGRAETVRATPGSPDSPDTPAAQSRSEVVVGVDARAPDDAVMAYAFAAATATTAATRRPAPGVRLRAVHAWNPAARYDAWQPFAVPGEDRAVWEDEEVRALAHALRKWQLRYPQVRVLADVRGLSPARALVRASSGAGLLVVGRSAAGRLGPVGDAVAHHARCPVVFVPRVPAG